VPTLLSAAGVLSKSKNYRKRQGLKQSRGNSTLCGVYETVGALQEKTQNAHRTRRISEVRNLHTMQ